MKFAKLIIAVAALVFAVALAFMLIGIIINLLWYAFVIAAIAAIGYVAYKVLANSKTPQLEEAKTPVFETSRANRELTEADRLLERYKNKISSRD